MSASRTRKDHDVSEGAAEPGPVVSGEAVVNVPVPAEPVLVTEMPDLSEVKIRDLLRLDAAWLAPTVSALLRVADQPTPSISGYNPRNLD
jgi:hypothetical protein